MNSPRFDHYEWDGGREAMLRFGPEGGPVVIAALPLFEEANRTRAFTVAILRALADRGIASVLPDLPGQGESLVPLDSVTVLTMQSAYEGAVATQAGRRCYGIGIRSGALLDALGLLFGRWHLAPQDGPALLRELTRTRQSATGEMLRPGWFYDDDGPIEIAGNLLSIDLLTDLTVKEPFDQPGIPRRVVRLESDTAPADRTIEAAPLWRRAEPGNDAALAELLADDIAAWIAICEG